MRVRFSYINFVVTGIFQILRHHLHFASGPEFLETALHVLAAGAQVDVRTQF